ncbi:MAG: hypothetical protein FD125_1486 [bacterium]|nr:MAG: hypothetical protein FD125_1486 [bacterium]
MKYLAITVFAVSVVSLAACEKAVEAPFDRGVCYAVEVGAEGEAPRFNKVADNQPQIEFCAARLEEVRLRFLRMGGSRQEITGSYQGQFIFIDRGGVWLSQTLDGGRFNAMARTGDGRLANRPTPSRTRPHRPRPRRNRTNVEQAICGLRHKAGARLSKAR